jgi:alpha/beta superfamily hydrolase
MPQESIGLAEGIRMEKQVFIKNGDLVIEALLDRGGGDRAAVICHPHPLMGGSMYNHVVETIQEAFATEGFSTLRFNFRGVGKSSGMYDEGRGEQEDILAVCRYLTCQGMTGLFFAGYSFGSWVGSKVIAGQDQPFSGSLFVSPPIDDFGFDWDRLKGKVDFIICGDMDPFCNADALTQKVREMASVLMVIQGADHFYAGRDGELLTVLCGGIKKSFLKKA